MRDIQERMKREEEEEKRKREEEKRKREEEKRREEEEMRREEEERRIRYEESERIREEKERLKWEEEEMQRRVEEEAQRLREEEEIFQREEKRLERKRALERRKIRDPQRVDPFAFVHEITAKFTSLVATPLREVQLERMAEPINRAFVEDCEEVTQILDSSPRMVRDACNMLPYSSIEPEPMLECDEHTEAVCLEQEQHLEYCNPDIEMLTYSVFAPPPPTDGWLPTDRRSYAEAPVASYFAPPQLPLPGLKEAAAAATSAPCRVAAGEGKLHQQVGEGTEERKTAGPSGGSKGRGGVGAGLGRGGFRKDTAPSPLGPSIPPSPGLPGYGSVARSFSGRATESSSRKTSFAFACDPRSAPTPPAPPAMFDGVPPPPSPSSPLGGASRSPAFPLPRAKSPVSLAPPTGGLFRSSPPPPPPPPSFSPASPAPPALKASSRSSLLDSHSRTKLKKVSETVARSSSSAAAPSGGDIFADLLGALQSRRNAFTPQPNNMSINTPLSFSQNWNSEEGEKEDDWDDDGDLPTAPASVFPDRGKKRAKADSPSDAKSRKDKNGISIDEDRKKEKEKDEKPLKMKSQALDKKFFDSADWARKLNPRINHCIHNLAHSPATDEKKEKKEEKKLVEIADFSDISDKTITPSVQPCKPIAPPKSFHTSKFISSQSFSAPEADAKDMEEGTPFSYACLIISSLINLDLATCNSTARR